MSRVTSARVDRGEEMFDRDIEDLIQGRSPVNTDLQPLRGVVEALRAMARVEVSDEFIEFHAAESAAAVAALRASQRLLPAPRGSKARLSGLRPRLATIGTSLALVLGMTGISWAADGAVPGDWYYGIDRALEAIGIGNGGEAERLHEQQSGPAAGSGSEAEVNKTGVGPEDGPVETGVGPEVTTEKLTGLERAAAAVANAPNGGGASAEARARVVERLQYLNEAGPGYGSAVSEPGQGRTGRPEQAGRADEAGRPEDVGKPDEKPAKAAEPKQKGRPEEPGNSQGSGRP